MLCPRASHSITWVSTNGIVRTGNTRRLSAFEDVDRSRTARGKFHMIEIHNCEAARQKADEVAKDPRKKMSGEPAPAPRLRPLEQSFYLDVVPRTCRQMRDLSQFVGRWLDRRRKNVAMQTAKLPVRWPATHVFQPEWPFLRCRNGVHVSSYHSPETARFLISDPATS